jgi:hypothetical protein
MHGWAIGNEMDIYSLLYLGSLGLRMEVELSTHIDMLTRSAVCISTVLGPSGTFPHCGTHKKMLDP